MNSIPVYAAQPAQQPAYVPRYIVAQVPMGFKPCPPRQDKPLFYNDKTGEIYDPTTNECYNPKTKHFEKPRSSYFNPNVFNPIVDQNAPQVQMRNEVRHLQVPEIKPVVHNGRVWQKICDVTNRTLKKLAGSLCLVFAAALALATACGSYATFALLIQQGNPVGAIVGFLTLYFGVATYKYAKIALSKLNQDNLKPIDCIQKA
ncbi:MAG: hypothetical protein LLG04_01070 [Parachlamydia sp.]|nr:hypothetical protein [Parachlamydia sp.]